MPYSFQSFNVNDIFTASQANQIEVNIRDHIHGRSGVVSEFDLLSSTGTAADTVILSGRVSGDAQPRWAITSNGRVLLGSGDAAADVEVRRGAADRLDVLDSLRLTGSLDFATDNTVDIGASAANRPRDIYAGRDLAFGGSVKNAVSPSTDAVYDVGGASFRWRDLRLSRDAYVGNTILIGTTTSVGRVTIQGDATTAAAVVLTQESADSSAPLFRWRKARGSVGAPASVTDGDQAGALSWAAYDGGAYRGMADISAYVDGTPGSNDMPGRLEFSTSRDGGTTQYVWLRLRNYGALELRNTSGNTILEITNSGGDGTGAGRIIFRDSVGASWADLNGASKEFVPSSDGTGSIGTASNRWSLVRAVTVTQGDSVLCDRETGEELYRIHEDGRAGILFDDIRSGARLARLDRRGNLWIAGRLRRLRPPRPRKKERRRRTC